MATIETNTLVTERDPKTEAALRMVLSKNYGNDGMPKDKMLDLLKLEMMFGSLLPTVISSALVSFKGGGALASEWFSQACEDLRNADAPKKIARDTTVTLARIDAFDQLVKYLKSTGHLDIPLGTPKSTQFDLVNTALIKIMESNIKSAKQREKYARAALPMVRAETELWIGKAEAFGRKALAPPRIIVTSGIEAGMEVAKSAVINTAKFVGEGGSELIMNTGKIAGTLAGVAGVFPATAVALGAEVAPYPAIPTLILGAAGMAIGLIVSMSKEPPRSAFTLEFWELGITYGIIGGVIGSILTIIIAKAGGKKIV